MTRPTLTRPNPTSADARARARRRLQPRVKILPVNRNAPPATDPRRARRDHLARWDAWLGAMLAVSVGTIAAAIGVSGGDPVLSWGGVVFAVVGAPVGWLVGRRSRPSG